MPPLPISLALYLEGNSDRHFLPIIILRTLEPILRERSRYDIDIPTDIPIINDQMKPQRSNAERILEAARCAEGYRILFIHRDADSPTTSRAFNRYMSVGINRVQQTEESVCKTIVPIIPVRNIEAWMLVDSKAIHTITETKVKVEDLGLPDRPHQVEAILDTKGMLKNIIQTAKNNKRRGRRDIPIAEGFVA